MLEELRQRLQPTIELLQDRWAALPEDRQQLIRVTAIGLAIVLPLVIVVVPLAAGRIQAHQAVANTGDQLEQMRRLERIVLKRGLADTGDEPVQRRPRRQRSLIAILDGVASNIGIGSLVQAMRPIKNAGRNDEDVEAVELQLKGVVLEELTKLLYQIEMNNPELTIRRIEIHKDLKEPTVLRTNIEVAR